mmetsp:Transcript_27423/g.70496  ORF Transcript_27423/g.70496 Transcript_27423/m.70496 type:complete len:247 (+) Transcript_27423:512-1252(+)
MHRVPPAPLRPGRQVCAILPCVVLLQREQRPGKRAQHGAAGHVVRGAQALLAAQLPAGVGLVNEARLDFVEQRRHLWRQRLAGHEVPGHGLQEGAHAGLHSGALLRREGNARAPGHVVPVHDANGQRMRVAGAAPAADVVCLDGGVHRSAPFPEQLVAHGEPHRLHGGRPRRRLQLVPQLAPLLHRPQRDLEKVVAALVQRRRRAAGAAAALGGRGRVAGRRLPVPPSGRGLPATKERLGGGLRLP